MIASMNPYSDEYLFTQYLQKKGTDAPLPPIPIEDYDLYSQHPWEIFDTSTTAREQTFFVFTSLRKNESRVLRTAGSGTWKQQHTKKIFDCGELVGYRRSFKFQDGCDSSATRGRWIMYEFSMCDERQRNCVLCKIKYYRDSEESKDKGIVILDNLPNQFEDKNRQAKKACLLHDSGDRTGDFAVALPSFTVDGAQTATAQAISSGVPNAEQLQMSMGAAPALHLDNDDPPFPGSSGDAIADSLASAPMQGSSDEWTELMKELMTSELDLVESRSVAPGPDIGDLTSLAFGSNTTLNSSFGCNRDANSLPEIATSALDTSHTTYQAFDDGPYTDQWIINVDINPLVEATAMLESTLGTSDNQMGGPTSLHQQRSVAESQEQEVSVPLEWADQFLDV